MDLNNVPVVIAHSTYTTKNVLHHAQEVIGEVKTQELVKFVIPVVKLALVEPLTVVYLVIQLISMKPLVPQLAQMDIMLPLLPKLVKYAWIHARPVSMITNVHLVKVTDTYMITNVVIAQNTTMLKTLITHVKLVTLLVLLVKEPEKQNVPLV